METQKTTTEDDVMTDDSSVDFLDPNVSQASYVGGTRVAYNLLHDIRPIKYVEEAQLLLAYAVQNGLEVETAVIESLVRAKHQLDIDNWSVEMETEFWSAFNTIAKIVAPVSVASLNATHKIENDEMVVEQRKGIAGFFSNLMNKSSQYSSDTAATITVNSYKRGSIFILVILLLVQIYWLIGTKVTSDITRAQTAWQTGMTSFTSTMTQLEKLNDEVSQLETAKDVKQIAATDTAEAPSTNNNPDYNNQLKLQLTEKYDLITQLTIQKDELYTKNLESSDQIRANEKLLKSWNTVWRFGFPYEQEIETIPKNIILLEQANIVLQVMQLYFLPLLYGLLGASAYVLRNIAIEIKTLTYAVDSNIRYRLRVQLGMLSGLAVGWFADSSGGLMVSEHALSFETLSPLALAFLAGYSVEVLFSFMDKLINAFSSSETPTGRGY